jgi:hypothetical protein
MTLSLYELTKEYTQALDFLTSPENECDLQTVLDTIESLDGVLDDKLLNVGRFISTIEAEAEAIEAVELRMRNRRQTLENKAAWLRDYLQSSMKATGHDTLKAPDIALKLAKLPASVNVVDESLIPDTLWRSTTIRNIDKQLIKQIGGCPGVVIESKGYRVSIK